MIKLLFFAIATLLPGIALADPVSVVVGAATMFGAAGAAGVAATAASVFAGTAALSTGLAFVGGALTLAGGLTNNKTLKKLGAVTGLAGAGVGLFQSLSGASSVANEGLKLGGSAGDGLKLGSTGAEAAAGASTTGSTEILGQAARSSADSLASLSAPATDYSLAGALKQTPSGLVDQSMGIGQGLKIGGEQVANYSREAIQAQGFGSKAMDWINKNPGVARVGAGLVSGAMKGVTAGKAADAQREEEERRRREYNDSVRDLRVRGIQFNPNADVRLRTPMQDRRGG